MRTPKSATKFSRSLATQIGPKASWRTSVFITSVLGTLILLRKRPSKSHGPVDRSRIGQAAAKIPAFCLESSCLSWTPCHATAENHHIKPRTTSRLWSCFLRGTREVSLPLLLVLASLALLPPCWRAMSSIFPSLYIMGSARNMKKEDGMISRLLYLL